MRHPYVEKYIQQPFIDDKKISILHDLYKQVTLTDEVKKKSIVTIMLVQIALDTHELIPAETNKMSESELQLSVLAGDYYSGLYYLLLSEIEDIHMVRILATSIRQINEYKMNLFYGDAETFHTLLEQMMKTESLLFTNVASYLGFEQTVVEHIEKVLLLNRLYREIQAIEEERHSYIYQFAQHQNMSDQSIHMVINQINNLKYNVSKLSTQLPYTFQQMDDVKDKYKMICNTTVAKEG